MVNYLEKMTAKKLRAWVQKLERLLENDPEDDNAHLYRKWLQEAYTEQSERRQRKQNYLNSIRRNLEQ